MAEQLYFKCTFEGCTHRPFSYFTINEHMAYHVKKKYETTEHFNLRCTQCNAFFMGNVHAEDHAKMKKHLVVANALKIFGKSDGTRRWVEMMKKWVRRPNEEEMSYMENQVFGCTPAYDRGRTPANDRGRTPGFERRRTPGFERGRTPGMDRGRTPANDRGRTPAFDRGRTPANERRRSPGRGRTPGFDRGRTPGFDRGRTPGFDRGRTPGFDRGRTPGFDRGRNPVDRGRIPENDRGRSHGIAPAIRRPRSPPNVEKVYRPSSPEILLSDDGGYSPGTVRSFVSSRSATPRSARVSPCRNNDYEYGSFNAFRPHPKPGYNREYDQEKHRPERRMRSELDLHNDRRSFNGTDRQMFQGSYSTGELGPRDNGDDARCSTSTSNLGGRLHQEQSTPQTSSDGHRVEKNGGNSGENNVNVPSDRRAIRSGAPPVFSPQKKFVSADPHPYATPRLLPNQESVKTKDNTVSSTIPTILINQDDSPEAQQSPEVIILENDATTTKKSQKKSTKGGKSKSKKGRIEKYGPAPPPEDDGELSPLHITPNFKSSQSEEKAKKDKMKKSLRKRHLVSDSEEDDGKKKKKKKKLDRSRRRRRSSSGSSSHDSRSPSRHRKRSRTRSRRRSRDSSTDSRSRRSRHSSKYEKRRSRSKDLSFSRSPRSK